MCSAPHCLLSHPSPQPADWDNQPAQIPDPDATKPEDWDDEDDGEWEAPLIENPSYKGEWKAPLIDNPAFKGVWKAKQIANPKYTENVAVYDNIGAVGFEVRPAPVCRLTRRGDSLVVLLLPPLPSCGS